MRISLLEKREDFYGILEKTLKNTDFFHQSNDIEIEYFVNRYLNFIGSETLPQSVFNVIKNEYSISVNFWNKFLQKVYVDFSVRYFSNHYVAHKTIFLSKIFKDYLIMGGNHRIRIFPKDLSHSVILLKEKENIKFCKNEIEFRSSNKIDYLPRLIDHGNYWIKEEYFDGIPINRLETGEKKDKLILSLVKKYYNDILINLSYELDINAYIDFIKNKLKKSLKDSSIVNESILKLVNTTLEKLFELLNNKDILCSISHGDLQHSNLLFRNGFIKIIDWEHTDKRFYLYDLFILFSMQRTVNNIEASIENYKKNIYSKNLNITIKTNDIYLFLIEEIRFRVDEDFSKNFKNFKNIQVLCRQTLKYIE